MRHSRLNKAVSCWSRQRVKEFLTVLRISLRSLVQSSTPSHITLLPQPLTMILHIQISRLSLHVDQLNNAKQTAKGPADLSRSPTTSRIFQILQYEEDHGFINSRGQTGNFNVVVVSIAPPIF